MTNPNIKSQQSLYQVLSLDVVLGSLAVGLFAVSLLDVNPNPWWWVILPCSVWVVYTLDHLLDGFRMQGNSSIYRHNFHYKNRKALLFIVAIITSITLTASLIVLDFRVILGGIGLGFIISIYFLILFFKKNKTYLLQKELFIAIVYLSGILLAPMVWLGHLPSWTQISIFIILAILAWVESIIISWYDYENDKADKLTSFSQLAGKPKTAKFIISVLSFLIVVLIAMFFITNNQPIKVAIVIEIIMSLILISLILFPKLFGQNHLFRWIGEGTFLLPACIVLF